MVEEESSSLMPPSARAGCDQRTSHNPPRRSDQWKGVGCFPQDFQASGQVLGVLGFCQVSPGRYKETLIVEGKMELDGNKAIVIIWQGCLCLVRGVSLKWDRHAKKQKLQPKHTTH